MKLFAALLLALSPAASAFTFDASTGLSNRVLTPNGDGLNDGVVFSYSNPADAAVAGEVFDLKGAKVADLTPGPAANTLAWDGKAGGIPVPSGVYLFLIRGEDKAFNGTLLVFQ